MWQTYTCDPLRLVATGVDWEHVQQERSYGNRSRHAPPLAWQVVDSVMDGFHGTIFAYGQTGSGKTYTMVGDRKDGVPGVMTLAVDQMFKHITEDTYRDYMIRVSYMEIYNEKVRDLLNPAAQNEELKVRNDAKKGFFVECQEVVCSNDEQIYSMLDAGNTLRTTAATLMNAASSRSHAIFR